MHGGGEWPAPGTWGARGRFVSFEGIEGSGKTTQLELLAQDLQEHGYTVMRTREPGGTRLGAELRALLLDDRYQPEPLAELFMLLADRAQHVRELVRPALAKGEWVLSDRYTDATRAYQLGGRRLESAWTDGALAAATGGLMPDLTLVLDVPVEVGLARVAGRGVANRLDQEAEAFHTAVRRTYQKLVQDDPGRIRLVDASGDPAAVYTKTQGVVQRWMRGQNPRNDR